MTISSTTNRIECSGDGVSTVFFFPYAFTDDNDLTVYVTEADGTKNLKTIATDYTVSGEGTANGGSVTMLTSPVSGETLVIFRDTPVTQSLNLVENQNAPAEATETALDRTAIISQRFDSLFDRTVKRHDGDVGTFDTTLPDPVANNVLGVNTAADAFEYTSLTSTDATLASQAEAEAGIENTAFMSPLRTRQAIDAYAWDYTTQASTYSADYNEFVDADASGGAFVVTVPTAVGFADRKIAIRKEDSDIGEAVTISGTGITTTTLDTQGETLYLVSDGANWVVVNRYIPSVWTAFTPTGTWDTNVTYTGYWMRIGGSAYIKYLVTCSGLPNNATILYYDPPPDMSIDTTQLLLPTLEFDGVGNAFNDGLINHPLYGYYHQVSDTIRPGAFDTATSQASRGNISDTIPFTFNTDDLTNLNILLPITGWNA